MFLKKYLVFAVSLFPFIAAAQIDVLEQLRSNPAYEVTLLEDSTVEIYNKHKNYRYLKTIKEFSKADNTTEANLIIELDTVNFAAYENLYRRWGSVEMENYAGKYISLDSNGDGLQEIYAITWRQPDFVNSGEIHKRIFDSLYAFEYAFSDTLINVFDVGDITGDGLLDLVCRGGYNWLIGYKQAQTNSYINTSGFIYAPFPSVYQPNDATLYDIDGDGNLEMIYFLDAGSLDSIWAGSNHIAKYNTQVNNYELIYYHRPQPDWYTNGISTGDFDQDGKGNFATGSIYGKFYIYEHVQGITYQVEFTKSLQTSNAYLTAFTEDMNGNSKPEVWIGGDIGGITRLYTFEASIPGVYEQVYQIDINGLSSFIDGKMKYVDLDGDGNKDLFLTNANLSFGFKYDGNGNYYMDFVIPAPRLDSIYTTQRVEGIDIADLDGNGVVEIIPQYFLSKGWPESWEYRSVFLKRDKLSDIDEQEIKIPVEYRLFQNYPNPFNPETNIKFALPSTSEVRIKIYNILGKEIKELLNETRSSGEYEIAWNGTDSKGNQMPSGVYFITISALPSNREVVIFQKTIKALLVK
ncbi:MAG: T9SS type A sorting domain-containing protein [Ignavibacteriaceae bacterium]|nr:T9SS type A sorting domain-containing protein [Ignavibacteriaceae bacterium]